jgi:hypothetical protein
MIFGKHYILEYIYLVVYRNMLLAYYQGRAHMISSQFKSLGLSMATV